MKFRYPEYYRKFRCTADKCSDSCCIGWEIDIDSDTQAYYRSVGGTFGRRLRDNISDGSFVLTPEERCPFLNSMNLCDIYTELGEDKLCQICSDHPRYYEWFGSVKEGGAGLCCEAAAELILTEEHILAEDDVPDEDCEDYDTELFELLLKARSEITDTLQNESFPEAVERVLSYAEELQYNIDNGEYVLPEGTVLIAAEKADIRGILGYYAGLEPINEKWIPYIRRCAELSDGSGGVDEEFLPYVRRIAVYFIFRYFLKGVFDGEILSRVKLAVLSSWVTAYLWKTEKSEKGKCPHEKRVSIAKDYSKEIEYCVENIAALSDAFYDNGLFSTPRLIWLYSGS